MRDQSSDPDLEFPDETFEELRAAVLRFRELRPLDKVVRHIGTFCFDNDKEACRIVDCCQRRLCSGRFRVLAWRDRDPAAKALTWHIELVLRFPKAFVDEPLCENCLHVLASRQAGRSREQFVQDEFAGSDPATLTWALPRGSKRREHTWDEIRRGWPSLSDE